MSIQHQYEKYSRSRTIVVALLLLATQNGCTPPDSTTSEPSYTDSATAVLGGSTTRLIFARPVFVDTGSRGFLVPAVIRYELSAVETPSGDLIPLPELPVSHLVTVTDGTWLATRSDEDDLVRAINLDSGALIDVLTDQREHGLNPIALDRGRVLLAGPHGGQQLLVLKDLTTGEQSLFLENLLEGNCSNAPFCSLDAALHNDILALRVHAPPAPSDLNSLNPPIATNIDYVNLINQSRTTIATFNGEGSLVAIGGVRIVWTETNDNVTIVHAYDTESGQVGEIVQLKQKTDPTSDYAIVISVGESGVVVRRSSVRADFEPTAQLPNGLRHYWLELVDYSGAVHGVYEFDDLLPYYTKAAAIGNSVVYRAGESGQWFVYDAATGETRAIAPF